MAIRLRNVGGTLVALCAARSVPKPGDLYLDDAAHHALAVKFDMDFASTYGHTPCHADAPEAALAEQEESNNANREEWDRTFGVHPGGAADAP